MVVGRLLGEWKLDGEVLDPYLLHSGLIDVERRLPFGAHVDPQGTCETHLRSGYGLNLDDPVDDGKLRSIHQAPAAQGVPAVEMEGERSVRLVLDEPDPLPRGDRRRRGQLQIPGSPLRRRGDSGQQRSVEEAGRARPPGVGSPVGSVNPDPSTTPRPAVGTTLRACAKSFEKWSGKDEHGLVAPCAPEDEVALLDVEGLGDAVSTWRNPYRPMVHCLDSCLESTRVICDAVSPGSQLANVHLHRGIGQRDGASPVAGPGEIREPSLWRPRLTGLAPQLREAGRRSPSPWLLTVTGRVETRVN